MKTILVKLRHEWALRILKDLEMVDLIKIFPLDTKKKLISNTLRGSLTKKKAEALGKQLKTLRGM